VGHTQEAKKKLFEIMGWDEGAHQPFTTPKPKRLIDRILSIAAENNAIVLDSFSGSGTTAHSVLAANKADEGTRRFVLVEVEDYAQGITAERVRRVIKGVPRAKDETLRDGLGGSFTFCELGDALELERFFESKGAPAYEQVARYVVYTATGESMAHTPKAPRPDWFIADAAGYRIHLIYKPDLDFMRSNDAALSMPLAEVIAKTANGKPALVYAAAKFMAQAELTKKGITFCQLPYSVHRVLGEGPDAA
jgi:adenine-specific DNA-methyltransferase